MNDPKPAAVQAAKLPWTTPCVELLGSMRDVKSGNVQPPNDGSQSPTVAAS